jgi:histidyl-tRNA synthetase
MPKFKAPRGTYDVLPDTASHWSRVETAFAEISELYGYGEIRTPMFEETDLFVRSSGETSEVVNKQMYTFLDKGERSMTLKPEGTAPVLRAVLEGGLLNQQGQVVRVWYKTPIFRYERPQKGRCRQAHQVGMELIGSSSPNADAEIIEMTVRFYQALGIKQLGVLVNSIGRAQARRAYADAILNHMASWLKDQDQEGRARAEKNPLRLLDSKDPSIQDLLSGAPVVTDYLEPESREHYDAVLKRLNEADIEFEEAPRIVRGLDYYTDTVFEVEGRMLGAQSALCGGGRYDKLIQELGGSPTPAVGAAMGIERALIAMEAEDLLPDVDRLDVFVVALGDQAIQIGNRIVDRLRKEGVSCQQDIEGKGMKNQMKQAGRSSARWTLILGEDEIAAESVTIKNMDTGDQQTVPQADLVSRLKS